MADTTDPIPTTSEMCGTFTDPDTPDTGRSYGAAIKPGCASPELPIDGSAEIVFVDGNPIALEIE